MLPRTYSKGQSTIGGDSTASAISVSNDELLDDNQADDHVESPHVSRTASWPLPALVAYKLATNTIVLFAIAGFIYSAVAFR